MAGTRLADVIVPEVFNDYVLEKSAETSALVQSGVIATDPEIQAAANGGGEFVNMPFFNDLEGDAEEGGKGFDGASLTPAKITSEKDMAVKIFRAKAWDASDFAGLLSGADPVGAIADRVAAFYVRVKQKALIASLNGVFAGPLSSSHVLDISGNTGAAAVIDGASTIDAGALLGDAAGGLTAIAMHGLTYAKLQKEKLIEYIPTPNEAVSIPTYLGKMVVVDDGLPVDTANGVYTTYLFGNGAIGGADINLGDKAVETDRDTLGGVDVLATRAGFIMHPRGVKWATTISNPTSAQLADGKNWRRVYEPKNIRIVAFKHKI